MSDAEEKLDGAITEIKIEAQETADEEVERILENAEAALSEAEKFNEMVAQAAVMTALGQQLEALKTEVTEPVTK